MSPSVNTAQSERRDGARRRMLKPVQVMSMDRKSASVVDCTLRTLSVCGAQLSGTASSISRIPAQFYLIVPGQLRMIRSKVVWKSYDAVGIMFLSDPGRLASEMMASIDHAATEPAEQPPKAAGTKAAGRPRNAAKRKASGRTRNAAGPKVSRRAPTASSPSVEAHSMQTRLEASSSARGLLRRLAARAGLLAVVNAVMGRFSGLRTADCGRSRRIA
jgi:hypothetical protein